MDINTHLDFKIYAVKNYPFLMLQPALFAPPTNYYFWLIYPFFSESILTILTSSCYI